MAASKNRVDWSLLCLRLAVGGMAILHGIIPLQHAGAWHFSHLPQTGLDLLAGLVEVVCGVLMVLGAWTLPAAIAILVLMSIPLARSLTLHSLVFDHTQTLFRMLVTFASGLAGPGKASLSK